MITRELYLGGPATSNASRAMLPAPTFSANSAVFKAMRPSLHKGGFLNRVLDFRDDKALANYVAEQAAAGTPITTNDVLGVLVVPQNIILRGMFYEVERAGNASLVLTPKLRVLTTAQPAITASALGKGAGVPGDGAWIAANGAMAGDPFAMVTPDMLDLTVTAIGEGLGELRLNIGIFFDDLTAGQY